MNPDQQAALDRVPRFLDDLEPINRKKLNQENKRKERWSLSGKQDDSQVLAEMGVAPLHGELSDDDKTSRIVNEDIENLNPNVNSSRSSKRCYLQAIHSPKDIKENENENKENATSAKKYRVMREADANLDAGTLSQKVIEENCSHDTEHKALSGIKTSHNIKSTQYRNANYQKEEKHERKQNVTDSICSTRNKEVREEDPSEAMEFNKVTDNKNNNIKDTETCEKQTINVEGEVDNISAETSNTEIQSVSESDANMENSNQVESSRTDDLNETKNVFSISEGEESDGVDKTRNKYVSKVTSLHKLDPHSDKCDENVCPLSTVDQVILNYTEELEQTLVHDKEDESEGYYKLTADKECFTLQDQSFCSGERCGTGTSGRCVSVDFRDTEDDSDSMFSKLSDEVILSILQWLPKRILVKCMHVCKRWRRLAADGRLWARVDLGGRVLPSGALQTLMNRHPLVLRMANAQLVPPAFPSPCTHEWRVQFLDLSCAAITPQDLTTILYNSPLLIKLSIEALTLDQCAYMAFSRLRQLRTLNASQVIGFNVDCCKSLAKMEKLEHLNVAWTRLDTEALDVLVSSLSSGLVRLNLAGCRKTIVDNTVITLIKRLPNLTELDLSDAAQITTASIKAITTLSSLEHLAISRCYCLQLRDYMMLEQCRSLIYVDAFGVLPPLNISILDSHLPNIQFNKFMHSSIARPTVGNRRTSIWGLRTRD